MTRTIVFLLAFGLVAACEGTNPLDTTTTGDDTTTTTTGDTVTGITGDTALPPGTASPTRSSAIVRYESGGAAESITYNNDAGQDEFFVDNLPFDGDNTYSRSGTPGASTPIGQLDTAGRFRIYEADATTVDPLTGTVLDNFVSRALYARSTSGMTEFAIVRSGSYANFGFGGYIYQRNETADDGSAAEVVIPTEGDALYDGEYGGIRVFSGATGLNFVAGRATVQIDFKDFNDGNAGVALSLYDRRLFDINGNDITAAYITAVETAAEQAVFRSFDDAGNLTLPDLSSSVVAGVLDENGEMRGGVSGSYGFADGSTATASSGTFYAIMAGTNAEEIVGIAVTTGTDPRFSDATFQETGGFLIYRQ